MRKDLLPAVAVMAAGSLGFACSDSAGASDGAQTVEQASSVNPSVHGRKLFFDGIPDNAGNGRVCSTCHVQEHAFALTPAYVEGRYQVLQNRRLEDPSADDPLFRSIDANDGAQDFTNLREHAIIKVVIKLPTDADGNKLMWPLDDPNATEVAVWRSVPSVLNTAMTAPYQLDGRFPTLQVQADAAFRAHSQVAQAPSLSVLDDIAAFEKTQFSSNAAANLSEELAAGSAISPTDPPLNALETEGKADFVHDCAQCHGGPTMTKMSAIMPDAAFDVFVSKPVPPFMSDLPFNPSPVAPRLWAFRVAGGDPQVRPSTDPGRALTTGDINHLNHFDVPTLFGISKTAPYFHDNSAATLEEVVRHYQLGALGLRRVIPDFVPYPIRPDVIPDSHIAPIVAYLKRI